MHRAACKYACGRTNEPAARGSLPRMKLDLRDSQTLEFSRPDTNERTKRSLAFCRSLARSPARLQQQQPLENGRKTWLHSGGNNQRWKPRVIISRRSSSPLLPPILSPLSLSTTPSRGGSSPLAACNLAGTLRRTYVRIRPLNPRT